MKANFSNCDRKFKPRNSRNSRNGSVTILVAFLLIVMMVMAVFAVDYGHLLVVRTDLQRAADTAALAAVQDLTPEADGTQDLDAVRARIREYAATNMRDDGFVVEDSDIQIGRYDPETIYSDLTLLNDGIQDTVRVTLRRDDLTNSSVTLLFARLIGIDTADVSATSTAVLQKARYLPPGSDILPIALEQGIWNAQQPGDFWNIYNGKLQNDAGQDIPGNWGTVDIGATNNSTADLTDQILNGLRQSDLDSLAQAGTIPSSEYIDGDQAMWVNGDTGLSSGMKSAVIASHGKLKLIPIYDELNDGNGGNLDAHIVGWGAVEIIESYWKGNKGTYIRIRKAYTYDGDLMANPDLSDTNQIIENAFTSPVLVE